MQKSISILRRFFAAAIVIIVSGCSIFETDNVPDFKINPYFLTPFQGVVYDSSGELMLDVPIQIDLYEDKDGTVKSRKIEYTDDFGSFKMVFSLSVTGKEWYYRLYVTPFRALEPLLASEGPVMLGDLTTLEIRLNESESGN